MPEEVPDAADHVAHGRLRERHLRLRGALGAQRERRLEALLELRISINEHNYSNIRTLFELELILSWKASTLSASAAP